RPQRQCKPRYELMQLAPRHAALDAIFSPENDRLAFVSRAQEILGEIDPRIREPLRPGHPGCVDERRAAACAAHLAEFPYQVPERFTLLYRPAVQLIPV